MIFFGAVALLVVVVAAVAGTAAFFAWSDSQLSLGDSNAKEALTAPEEGAPITRCSPPISPRTRQLPPHLTRPTSPCASTRAPARLLSSRCRPRCPWSFPTASATPSATPRRLAATRSFLRAAGSLLGVQFAHFASTDAEGLASLVDLVGGVPVELSEEVDDPRAGIHVLAAGSQTLDGAQALTLLRAANYSDAMGMQAKMRALFTVNLAERATSGEGLSFPSVIADGAPFVSTDWTSGQLISLGDALSPLTEATVYAAVVPGRLTTSDEGEETYEVSGEDLAAMMEAVNAGNSPESFEGNLANVDRSLVTVEVRNGSGIQGAAARCGELLTSAGYDVKSVGNVDDGTVYPETLVIYKDEAFEIAAKAIVSDLSAGRVVNGGDFYTFDTNVLVIIGTDWIG